MKKVFAAIAGKVRRLTAPFRERPTLRNDDYVMEHFLLYNGLIGSTPENQPEYKDVRNDIVQAVNDNSAHQLAIALKLPPLWWEDRLEKVFGEIDKVNRDGALRCLSALRPDDDTIGDTAPLSHSDWRVRSNAARMLAFLQAKEAVPRLVELLAECQNSQAAAFCHIAHALARLGAEQGRQALVSHLGHEEHWFRVDVVSSLAHWNLPSVAPNLMQAVLAGCDFDDYMAVAICRHHKPASFAEFHDDEIHDGLAELSLALVKAAEGPFHAEHSIAGMLEEVLPKINQLALTKPSSRRISAAIVVNEYLDSRGSNKESSETKTRDLSRKEAFDAVKTTLQEARTSTPAEVSELKHALKLVANYKLTELSSLLIPLLKGDFPLLPELMLSFASLGDINSAEKIADLVESKIDFSSRCAQSFSAHPVLESDKASADLYWSALKAMGALPHAASLRVLSKAVNDFAPDKREEALLSLQAILVSEGLRKKFTGDFEALLRERILDPAVGVQVAALSGVAQHNLDTLIPDVLKATQSKETAVQRRAGETLLSLAGNGHKSAVKTALEAGLSKEYDSGRKQRLGKILESLES